VIAKIIGGLQLNVYSKMAVFEKRRNTANARFLLKTVEIQKNL